MNGYEIYNKSSLIMSYLMLRGVFVDTQKVTACLKEAKEGAFEWQKDWVDSFPFGRLLMSSKYLGPILRENKCRLEYTSKGKIKIDDEALKKYSCGHVPNQDLVSDFCSTIRKVRYYTQKAAVFQKYMSDDGRVYPTYNTAKTGRFRCSNPNIQNLSKEEAGSLSERGCIIPPLPLDKKVFVGFDYSQGEYRLFADYIDNRKLIKKLNEGEDYHALTGQWTGLSRAEAKNVNFAMLYGAGDERLGEMIKCSPQKAGNIALK